MAYMKSEEPTLQPDRTIREKDEILHGYPRTDYWRGFNDGVERVWPQVDQLRAAAKRVLEADMCGVRDLDALNALEDAAGFSQQVGT